MCGIVAYIGNKDPKPILIGGLHRLEYRGYDSAGIFLCSDSESQLTKITGKVNDLSKTFVKVCEKLLTTVFCQHGNKSPKN